MDGPTLCCRARSTRSPVIYSPDSDYEHSEQQLEGYLRLMQADAYAGFSKLNEANRKASPVVEAACQVHSKRKFFDLKRPSKAPIASEAVNCIDAVPAIEREIKGLVPQFR